MSNLNFALYNLQWSEATRLRLIQRAPISSEQNLSKLIEETKQLSNIIAKSIITAKEGKLGT